MSNRIELNKRVKKSAELILADQSFVSPLNLLIVMNLISKNDMQNWRKGKIPYLERAVTINLSKLTYIMKCFRAWANNKGLKSSYTAYIVKKNGRWLNLQFSKSANPTIEKHYCTHYVDSSIR